MNNQSNDKVLNLIVIVFILICVFYIVYYIVNKTDYIIQHDKNARIYNIMKGNQASNDLDLCKFGCERGVCKLKNKNKNHSKNHPHLCKYDFQCNYCKDRKTNNFYVDLTNYEEVLPDYDLQDELSKTQSESLNDEIKQNNEYIDDLNDKIQEYNGIKVN